MFRTREFQRLFRWVRSEEGRTQIGYGISGLTICTTAAVFLKETYVADRYIRIAKLLYNPETKIEVRSSDTILDIFAQEYNQSGLASNSSLALPSFLPPKLFVTRDLNTYSSGKNGIQMGYNFGLPLNFNCNSVEEILNHQKLFRHILQRKYKLEKNKIKQDDWQQLANNLYLSESAKRFQVQYELQKQVAMSSMIVEAASFMAYGTFIYLLSLTTNNLFDLLKKPMYIRMTSYAGFFAVCTLSFLQLRDDIYGWRSRKGLRKTLESGDEYLEGAKEILRKRLAVNRTIAKMLGPKEGAKKFTNVGEEKGTIIGFRELKLMKQLELVETWESLKELPPLQQQSST